MLEAIKIASLLQRVAKLQATAMSARRVLRMATIEGAKALELGHMIGSLEPGKEADVVVFDGSSVALANVQDPFESIVYVAGPRDVKEVWIAGELLLEGGAVRSVDVAEIVERARPLSRKLIEIAGV